MLAGKILLCSWLQVWFLASNKRHSLSAACIVLRWTSPTVLQRAMSGKAQPNSYEAMTLSVGLCPRKSIFLVVLSFCSIKNRFSFYLFPGFWATPLSQRAHPSSTFDIYSTMWTYLMTRKYTLFMWHIFGTGGVIPPRKDSWVYLLPQCAFIMELFLPGVLPSFYSMCL